MMLLYPIDHQNLCVLNSKKFWPIDLAQKDLAKGQEFVIAGAGNVLPCRSNHQQQRLVSGSHTSDHGIE